MVNKRNTGIDCLRIVAMLYIVTLHYNGFGGIMPTDSENFPLYALSGSIQMLTICAVNCFAIISGYVGYSEVKKPYRFYSYLSLWLEVAVYSFILYSISYFCGNGTTWKDCLKALFPLTTNMYWYFTAYTPLFFLIPFLNDSIRYSTRQQMLTLCLILTGLFCFVSASGDAFHLHSGYSFAWLLLLYLIGATLKKCDIVRLIPTSYAFTGILLLWLFRTTMYLYGPNLTVFLFKLHRSQLESYTNLSTLLLSVLHIIGFADLRTTSPKLQSLISKIAPRTFSIYLLNTHPVVWSCLILGSFSQYVNGSLLLLLFRLISTSCVFVIVSILIDVLRNKLFELFSINTLTKKIGQLGNVCIGTFFCEDE